MAVSRFDVYVVRLDPAQGREIQKTRPCLVISPDELNRQIGTVIVCPADDNGTHLSYARIDSFPEEKRTDCAGSGTHG